MKARTLHIVAVDDDPADLEILRRLFDEIDSLEVELHGVGDVREAMLAVSAQTPALVFVDVMLGAHSGIALMKALKDSGCDAPVVVLTGHGDEELAVEALQAGAADYLAKGNLTVGSLERVTRNAMERHEMETLVRSMRKSLEDSNRALEKRNREIRSFYHVLSHELKSPLTSALAFLEITIDGLAGSLTPTQREYLESVKESCDQIKLCINDLFDATRLETGKLSLELADVALDEVAHRVVGSLFPIAAERCIALESSSDDDVPRVRADRKRIAQVLTNLINNALKFTPEMGVISVHVRRAKGAGDAVEVAVKDTGRGIPPDQLDRIFDRLYQVEHGDAASGGGLGLGLSICRDLVQLHGGVIAVKSEPGHGSEFTFTVPCCQEALQTT